MGSRVFLPNYRIHTLLDYCQQRYIPQGFKMKINCREQWIEGLKYFLDPHTIANLRAVGLHVEKMDWRNQQVILGVDSEDQLQAAIEGVAQIEENQSVWATNI